MCEFFAPAAAIYLVPSGWKADTPIVSLAEYNDAKDKSNKVVKTSMQEVHFFQLLLLPSEPAC